MKASLPLPQSDYTECHHHQQFLASRCEWRIWAVIQQILLPPPRWLQRSWGMQQKAICHFKGYQGNQVDSDSWRFSYERNKFSEPEACIVPIQRYKHDIWCSDCLLLLLCKSSWADFPFCLLEQVSELLGCDSSASVTKHSHQKPRTHFWVKCHFLPVSTIKEKQALLFPSCISSLLAHGSKEIWSSRWTVLQLSVSFKKAKRNTSLQGVRDELTQKREEKRRRKRREVPPPEFWLLLYICLFLLTQKLPYVDWGLARGGCFILPETLT